MVEACAHPSLPTQEVGQIVPVLEAQGYNQPTNFNPSTVEHPHYWMYLFYASLLFLLAFVVYRKRYEILNVVQRVSRLLELRRNRITQQRFVPVHQTFPFRVETVTLDVDKAIENAIIEIPELD